MKAHHGATWRGLLNDIQFQWSIFCIISLQSIVYTDTTTFWSPQLNGREILLTPAHFYLNPHILVLRHYHDGIKPTQAGIAVGTTSGSTTFLVPVGCDIGDRTRTLVGNFIGNTTSAIECRHIRSRNAPSEHTTLTRCICRVYIIHYTVYLYLYINFSLLGLQCKFAEV